MSAYSLRRRLLTWLLISTAVLGALALADTWREAVRTSTGVSDRVLAGSALAIAERVSVNEDGAIEVDIPYSALEMLASTAQDQVFYRVDGPQGRFLTGYETLRPLPAAAGAEIVFSDGQVGETPTRIATLHRQATLGFEGMPFSVTVAESTLARSQLARSILFRSAARLSALALGAAAIVWLAVTLALRPLNRLGEAIASRSPDDLRPIRERTPTEVEGLVEAVNSFMARLETALAALRNFTGNASHQLRTPLAVMRTQMALASRSGDPAQARAAVDKADQALARAERVLAQLLLLARVDAASGRAAFPALDLAPLARDVTAEMVPSAAHVGIDLGYEGAASAMIRAEPVLVSELLRNLLDNAVAYSGQGATVTVRVARAGADVTLTVEDSGPGIAPDRIETLVRRKGAMIGDEGQGGYGLGLAVVQEIAQLFGGSLGFRTDTAGPGFAAVLTFPRLAGSPARLSPG